MPTSCGMLPVRAHELEGHDLADIDRGLDREGLELSDRWLLSRLDSLIAEVEDSMQKYELGIAAQSCTTSFGENTATGI